MDVEPALPSRSRTERTKRKRSRASETHPVATWSALVLFASTVIVAPQLFGGDPWWSRPTLSALSVLTLGTTLFAFRSRLDKLTTPAPLVVLFALSLFTALQAAPLPCSLVAPFARESVSATMRTAAALGDPAPSWCTLSLDPGRTRLEWLKHTDLAAFFLAAWVLVTVGERRDYVARSLAASFIAMTAVVIAHSLTGTDKVFGLYSPVHAAPTRLGPLMNDNHLGGFLAMGLPLLGALALGTRTKRSMRIPWAVAFVAASALALTTPSRGGIAAAIGAIILFAGTSALLRRHRGSRSRGPWVFGGLALLGTTVAIVLYLGLDAVLRDFGDRLDTTKVEIALRSFSVAVDHPWLGIGRGAFAAAFVERAGTTARFLYPENIVVQWTSEWGLFVGLSALAGLGAPVVRSLVTTKSVTRASACIGVLVLVLHDLVDFALEMEGIAVVAVAMLAFALAPSPSEQRHRAPSDAPSGARNLSFAVLTFAALTGALVAPRASALDLHESEDRIRAALRERRDARIELRSALTLHPSEPVFALLAATDASMRSDRSALRWVNRAMELAPHWTSPHLVAADWLRRHGALDQALLEVREAATLNPRGVSGTFCRILLGSPSLDTVLRAAPPGEDALVLMNLAASCAGISKQLEGEIDAKISSDFPRFLPARQRLARRLVAATEFDRAIAVLEESMRIDPHDVRTRLSLGDARLQADRPAAALDAVREAQPANVNDAAAVIRIRIRAAAALRDESAMEEAIAELRGLTGGTPRTLANALSFIANVEARRGNFAAAMRYETEAYRSYPQAGSMLAVARAAERLGDSSRAYQAYGEVCRRFGSAAACSSRDRLLAALRERSLEAAQPSPTAAPD
jgi:tetratricopeptide (TPR) repeat protein